jgi:transcriptional regulator with XRE-family HTH domain
MASAPAVSDHTASDRDVSLVPPYRLGRMLAEARQRKGLSLLDVERVSYGKFSVEALTVIEAGAWMVNDGVLQELSQLYGIELAGVVPQRSELVVDVDEGRLAIGRKGKHFAPNASPRQVLLRYLALISALRDMAGSALPLREEDLRTLGHALSIGPGHVRRELDHLMVSSPKELEHLSHSLARRLAVPALGFVVAVTAAGGLLLVKQHNDTTGAPAARTAHVSTAAF